MKPSKLIELGCTYINNLPHYREYSILRGPKFQGGWGFYVMVKTPKSQTTSDIKFTVKS